MPDEVSGAPQAFIAYMAVDLDARRQGVAGMLLARAEEIAKEQGLPALALMVTEGNEAARELYAQAGFVTERRLLVKTL
jgi:ribosomal protein S18 acetylase RimI-like enzyme